MDFPKPASEVRAPRDPSRKSRSSNLPCAIIDFITLVLEYLAVEMYSVLATVIVARIEAPLLTRSSEAALGYSVTKLATWGGSK